MNSRSYSEAVREATGWWGTFPLDLPLKVGDIVEMNQEGFIVRVGSLLNWPGWGAAMPIDSEPVTAANSWSRHAAKNCLAAAQGGVAAVDGSARGAIQVLFSQEAGFLLDYFGGKYLRLRDVTAAKRAVLGLAKNGEWDIKNVLVSEVFEASPATVLVSSARNVRIELSARVTVPADLKAVNLSDPQFSFSVSSADEGVYHSVSKVAYPLYHCIKIRATWFGGHFAELQADGNVNVDDAFTDMPFDDHV